MDISATAERLTAAMNGAGATETPSAPADSTPSTPSTSTVSSTPSPSSPSSPSTPAATAPPSVPPAVPGHTTGGDVQPPVAPEGELTFDEPDELSFDEPDTPEPEPPAPAVPAPVPPAAGESEEDLDALPKIPGMTPRQVEHALLATNRGRNLLATYKDIRELKSPPNFDPSTGENHGGLGRMPTAAEIKEFHQAHSDYQALHHEFVSNPQSFANHWIQPDPATGKMPDGAGEFIAEIPNILTHYYGIAQQTGNQQLQAQLSQAADAIFRPLMTGWLNRFYNEARAVEDPDTRTYWLTAARAVEFHLTGQYRPDDALAPPKPEDALVTRERALQQREQQIQTWQHSAQTAAAQTARNNVVTEIDRSLEGDIEKAFTRSNLKSAMRPAAYKAAFAAYKQDVINTVKRDQATIRNFNFALSRLGGNNRNGADAHRAAVQAWRSAAQQVIRATHATYIRDLAGDAVRQNGATHATAAAAASQTAPAANGGPNAPQSVVSEQRVARLPGEDTHDFFIRRLESKGVKLGSR